MTDYAMDFAHAHGKPDVDARFRVEPRDFVVDEILGFEPTGTGEHLFIQVRKTGANTAWVADSIARFLELRSFDVSYSGKKDRHAVTTQWFSCWLPGREDPDWDGLALDGVEIVTARRNDKKLRRGMHEENRFAVRLRDVGEQNRETLSARAGLIERTGFPNYFGEQRFGHDGGNLAAADALLAGRERGGAKRDIYLSAARGYLFNLDLSSRVRDGSWLTEPFGWLAGLSRRGDAVFRTRNCFTAWHDGLDKIGMKAMRRDLVTRPGNFSWAFEDDDMLLDFTLGSGSYATSLLRELVNYNNESGRPSGDLEGLEEDMGL